MKPGKVLKTRKPAAKPAPVHRARRRRALDHNPLAANEVMARLTESVDKVLAFAAQRPMDTPSHAGVGEARAQSAKNSILPPASQPSSDSTRDLLIRAKDSSDELRSRLSVMLSSLHGDPAAEQPTGQLSVGYNGLILAILESVGSAHKQISEINAYLGI